MTQTFTAFRAAFVAMRKVSLALLIVVLVSLVLAGAVNAAPQNKEKGPNCSDQVDNDGDKLIDGDDPDCGGSGGDDSSTDNTVFHVVALTESGANPWSTAADPVNCAAYAPADGRNFSAQFPRHLQCVPQCWISLDDYSLTDDIDIHIKTRKGRFIELSITGQDWIGSEGIMHESDPVFLDYPVPEDLSVDFTIPVDQDVTIYRLKGHLGGPREGIAGVIQIGELMYSPCVLGTNCPSSGDNNYPDACPP